MADITIAATDVAPGSGAKFIFGTAGETIAAGKLVYRDASDKDNQGNGKFKLADGNSGTSAVREVVGLAANTAAAGQPLHVITEDAALTIGTHGVTVGEPLFLSNTAGGICPYADLAAGNYTAHVAQVKTASVVSFKINAPLVAHG